MFKKLAAVLLVGLGLVALHSTVRYLWWAPFLVQEKTPPPPPGPVPPKPGWHLALQSEALSLEARLGADRLLADREAILPVRLLLSGRQAPGEKPARMPLNIALVIDRSGSMEEDDRIGQVKRTLELLIDRLQPEDSVALVSYSTGVTVHRQSGPPLDKAVLRELARSLRASGGTNLSGGLEAGCREVQNGLRAGINRVLLFSDGLANIGLREPREIVSQLRPCLDSGVTITSVGVGADFNEDLMAELAELGRGNYWFVERAEEMAPAIARELEELGSVVAQSAVLRLDLPEGVQLAKVYGYRHEVRGQSVLLPLKDVFAGEQRKILVELRVAAGAAVPSRPIVLPALDYADARRVQHSLVAPAALSVASASTQSEVLVDPEVAAEVLYTRNSEALQDVGRLVGEGRSDEAEKRLQQVIQHTQSSGPQARHQKVQAQMAQMESSLQDVKKSKAAPQGDPQRKVLTKRMKDKARTYSKQ